MYRNVTGVSFEVIGSSVYCTRECICRNIRCSHIFFSRSNLYRKTLQIYLTESLFSWKSRGLWISYFILNIQRLITSRPSFILLIPKTNFHTHLDNLESLHGGIPFHFTLEQKMPEISYIGTVTQEVADLINIIAVWPLRWGFYFHVDYLIYTVGWFQLKWLQFCFPSSVNVLVKISAHPSNLIWLISFHLWIHVAVMKKMRSPISCVTLSSTEPTLIPK